MPKVSIILTTFNGATRGFLEEAIESVLYQTYKDFELLIIDDGSTDNTQEFCENFLDDTRIKYFFKENGGISSARNKGIQESVGDYVCFIDDDDVWLSEKLEKQIKFFENCKDPKIGIVHTWVTCIDGKGENIGGYSYETHGDIRDVLFEKNVINATSSVMIKKNVFDKSGIFKEHMMQVEDYELWLRIAKCFHIYSVNEPLIKYRIHNINKRPQGTTKDFIYSRLAFHYALEGESETKSNKIYCQLCKNFAEHQFSLKNYSEFRKYCRLSRVYGSIGVSFRLRYLLSYFPNIVNVIKKFKYRLGSELRKRFVSKNHD